MFTGQSSGFPEDYLQGKGAFPQWISARWGLRDSTSHAETQNGFIVICLHGGLNWTIAAALIKPTDARTVLFLPIN